MKNELIIGFFITFVLITLGLFFVQSYKLQQAKFAVASATNNALAQNALAFGSADQVSGTSTTEVSFLTVQEVATHNTAADCWLLINNKVYNATSYLNLHPGGRDRIIPYCGRDATQAFVTKGGEGNHSNSAFADLAKLYIGDIGSALPASGVPVVNEVRSQLVTNSNQLNPVSTTASAEIFLSVQEVATHNTAADCWLLISGKVYNATSYLNSHPGGRSRIIPYCGQDATQAFQTQGGGGSHSSGAFADLTQLYIGDIGSNAQTTLIDQTSANQNITNTNNEDQEDEDEDEEWEDD